jgi:hypothetical protein
MTSFCTLFPHNLYNARVTKAFFPEGAEVVLEGSAYRLIFYSLCEDRLSIGGGKEGNEE